eukprot:scaffold67065_cov33-Prasinocladus_malaysianus.AAC.1
MLLRTYALQEALCNRYCRLTVRQDSACEYHRQQILISGAVGPLLEKSLPYNGRLDRRSRRERPRGAHP